MSEYDEPRFIFAGTLFDDTWPNGAYNFPQPEADDPPPRNNKEDEDEQTIQ